MIGRTANKSVLGMRFCLVTKNWKVLFLGCSVRVFRGRMVVVLHNSPLPEGNPSGLPHARRCASRMKRPVGPRMPPEPTISKMEIVQQERTRFVHAAPLLANKKAGESPGSMRRPCLRRHHFPCFVLASFGNPARKRTAQDLLLRLQQAIPSTTDY